MRRRDRLTGLLLAADFRDALIDAHRARRHAPYAVAIANLDGFLLFNDQWSHQGGDDALVVVARRLRRVAPKPAVVARISGDEFGVIATEVVDGVGALELGESIRAAIAEPLVADAEAADLTASVGVACSSEGHWSPDVHLAAVRDALLRAKRAGGDTVRVDGREDSG